MSALNGISEIASDPVIVENVVNGLRKYIIGYDAHMAKLDRIYLVKGNSIIEHYFQVGSIIAVLGILGAVIIIPSSKHFPFS